RNKDIDLTDLIVDFPTHVRIDVRSVEEIKRNASAQHASQGGRQMRRGLMGFVIRLMGEREEFMRAYPPVNGNFRTKTDLFDL
ncbi:MAG: GlcNAc-PI de-N-acetylase, partial [Anaerolineae bacterium]|nr:GlcNAc-PI de-N-acetylase [Anaerolineae bacterium]